MSARTLLAVVILSFYGICLAVSFGNPADMPPRGSIDLSAEYSKQFLYTANDQISCQFTSHRFIIRCGYVFFKWFEVFGCIGGADADLTKEDLQYKTTSEPEKSDGSWEIAPGLGVRIKPPVKFSAMGFKFHILIDGRYLFIRSLQEADSKGFWTKKGTVNLNEFETAGLIVGYNRRFNLSFYGGVAIRYIWAEMPYTKTASFTNGYTTIDLKKSRTDMLGTSMSRNEKFVPHMVLPVIGLNLHLGKNYVFSFEANLADVEKLMELGPKIGITVGLSQYR